MSDADELARTRPTERTNPRNEGEAAPAPLPEEPEGRFGGEARELGRGGMGRVLEVRDVALGRSVALKELLDRTASTSRFVREARLTAQLEHPGVVPVYELGQRRDGAPYYAMRKVSGGTLEAALEACATLEDRLTLLPHLLDVVQTIAYAHARGVLHRDLKPANVMIGQFGETVVLDWGLARPKAEAEPPAAGAEAPTAQAAALTFPAPGADQTRDGASIGTPAYMSPEQAYGEVASIDERSDVWSLGVMLFELLCGRLPFLAETSAQMMVQVARQTPPRVRGLEPRAPRPLAQIADRALQRERAERFASAVEMAAALEEALRVHQRPRRAGWALAGVATLALVAHLAVLLFRGPGEHAPEVSRAEQEARLDASVRAGKAAAAQAAWEAGDVEAASRLASEALPDPLARGVVALARAAGVPERAWAARTEAGCAQLALLEGAVGCATFGGLALYGKKDGAERPRFGTGPSGWQHAVVALPADRLFAVAGDDEALHLVQPEPLREVERLGGLGDSVRSLAASPDGAELALGLRDGRVLRWRRGDKEPRPLFTLSGPVAALAWSRDGMVAASSRDATRVVQVDQPATALLELDRPSRALAFSASWPLYATAGRDVLALAPARDVRVFSGARHDLSSLLLLGNRLIAASVEGEALGWTTEGAPTGALRAFGPGRLVLAAEGGRGGRAPDFYAASGKSLEAWSWKRERFTQPPPELPGEASAFTFAPDATWCAGLRDGRVACQAPGRVGEGHRHARAVAALALAPAGDLWSLASAAADGTVLLSAPGKERSSSLSRPGKRPLAVALSVGGARLAVSWEDGTLALFSAEYGKEIELLRDAAAQALAFSPDGKSLAAARADKRVVLYDAETGKELRRFEGADGPLRAVAFAPDGARLAAGGEDRRVSTWATADGRLLLAHTGPRGAIGAVAFSSDGQRLAAASDEGAVWLWGEGDARPLAEVRGHFGDAFALAYRSDGALAEAAGDGVPRVLELP